MFNCSCSATSFLKETSISFLNTVFFSNISKKLSREKNDTMMESSFVMEAVAEVALESGILCLGVVFPLVVDEGERVFVLYVIGNLDLTFICILRWIVELNDEKCRSFLESSCICY